MHLDQFSEGNSFLHRIDPRIKIIVYVPLVCMIALSDNRAIPITALSLAIVFIGITRMPLRSAINRLFIVNIFIVFLWLTLPFSMPGKTLVALGRLTITYEGIACAFLITLKANAIFLFTISILGTTSIVALTHACAHFKVSQKLTSMFFFFYRYISDLHEEYIKLLRAVKARAFQPKTDMQTFRTYAFLVGMLFIKSYERSQRVYQALQLRGFKGYFPMLTHFHYHKSDIAFASFMGAFLLLLGLLWK